MSKANQIFVTIFPDAKDIHLRKSVGKIPYYLNQDYGLEAFLVCFKNQVAYPSLLTDVKGLKLHFLKNWLRFSPFLATVFYLILKAKKIDFLMLYGQSRYTFFVGLFYKIINKNGKLLFKADMNIEYLQRLKFNKNFTRHYTFWHYYFETICDTVCAEYPTLKKALVHLYNIPVHKVILLPNGVDKCLIDLSGIKPRSFEQKQNIILIVARVGAPEKNHKLILEAAQRLNLKDWRINFVGQIEEQFSEQIQQFFKLNTHLKDKIIFEPHIDDYSLLCRKYNESRVFCLSSIKEGFPVVVPEAMFWGNCIVSTKVSALPDILEGGSIGFLFDTDDELVEILQSIIDDPSSIQKMILASTEKANEQYVWRKIIGVLATKLQLQ